MDPKITQEIKESYAQLKEQDPGIRAIAARHLGQLGVVHPQIIEALERLCEQDPSEIVREAAGSSLAVLKASQANLQPVITPAGPPAAVSIQTQPGSGNERKIIDLLTTQNQLIEQLNANLLYSMEKDQDKSYALRTRVIDVNMSIGAMMGFMLKWMIASIPVAIIIGILWFVIAFFLMIFGMGLN